MQNGSCSRTSHQINGATKAGLSRTTKSFVNSIHQWSCCTATSGYQLAGKMSCESTSSAIFFVAVAQCSCK